MRFTFLVLLFGLAGLAFGQQADTARQREAMKKLDFLAGKWSGDASVSRGPGAPVKVRQTEEIDYRLGGLVMLIQGTGRNPDGKIAFQALATVSYDDHAGTYRFRAYHDGNYLDTVLNVMAKGFSWAYEAGPAKVVNTMSVNENGEWVETTEVAVGANPPRKSVEMLL